MHQNVHYCDQIAVTNLYMYAFKKLNLLNCSFCLFFSPVKHNSTNYAKEFVTKGIIRYEIG